MNLSSAATGCFAYLDPSNTSMLVPAVMAAIGSVLVAFRYCSRSLLGFVRSTGSRLLARRKD